MGVEDPLATAAQAAREKVSAIFEPRAAVPPDKLISIDQEGVEALRLLFEQAGFRLDDLTPEQKDSLRKAPKDYNFPPFRADDLTVGRGPGMLEVMGELGVAELNFQCNGIGLKYGLPGIKRQPKSRGRGLFQTAGDLVSMVVFIEDEEYVQSLVHMINRRIGKGLWRKYKDKHVRAGICEKYGFGEDGPPKKLSSSLPGAVQELVTLLTEGMEFIHE